MGLGCGKGDWEGWREGRKGRCRIRLGMVGEEVNEEVESVEGRRVEVKVESRPGEGKCRVRGGEGRETSVEGVEVSRERRGWLERSGESRGVVGGWREMRNVHLHST